MPPAAYHSFRLDTVSRTKEMIAIASTVTGHQPKLMTSVSSMTWPIGTSVTFATAAAAALNIRSCICSFPRKDLLARTDR